MSMLMLSSKEQLCRDPIFRPNNTKPRRVEKYKQSLHRGHSNINDGKYAQCQHLIITGAVEQDARINYLNYCMDYECKSWR